MGLYKKEKIIVILRLYKKTGLLDNKISLIY